MSLDNPREAEMVELLDRAERRIASLEARLARIEGADNVPVIPAPANTASSVPEQQSPVPVTLDEVSSRRGLFKVAGAVASAAVAHSLLSAAPAAAADGGNLVIGQANQSTTETALTKSSNGAAALIATNGSTSGTADGVKGVSNSNLGAGVAGSSTDGYGVFGTTTNGYAMYANGRLGVGVHLASPGAPTSGDYFLGDIVRDNVGNMFVCVVAGAASGSAAFRKIAGPSAAGQLHLLAAPMRAYDSRPAGIGGAATGGDGAILSGVERVISLALGRQGTAPAQQAVPSGATGAPFTVTLAETVNRGFLAVFSNAVAYPGTSTINWSASGTAIATTTTSAVDSLQRIKIRCGGTETQVIIDVLGYYL